MNENLENQNPTSLASDSLARQSQDRESLIHALFETMPLGVAIFDTHLRFVRVNPVWTKIIPQFPNSFTSILTQALETGLPIRNTQVDVTNSKYPEKNKCLQVNITPIRSLSGEITGLAATITDTTDSKKIEQRIQEVESALQKSEERLRQAERRQSESTSIDYANRFQILSEAIPNIVWTANEKGECDYFNSRWYEFSGLNFQASQGQSWTKSIHPDDRKKWQLELERALRTEDVASLEMRQLRKDGTYRWHLARAVIVRDGIGTPVRVIGTFTDITEQKLTQASQAQFLELSRLDLESLKKEREIREQFVATLSHDLRNPLGSAKMAAQILLAREDDSLRRELLMVAETNINRADRMIEDLLDANRIQAGESLPLKIGFCDLQTVVMDSLAGLSLLHGDRFVIHSNKQIVGYWDGQGLQRVIENLSANAVKYGAPHAPIIITLSETDGRVRISVHNEGNELTNDEKKILFTPFCRTKSAEESGKKGWGLGLTLVRGLTEAHGGTVCVQSEPNLGTTFTIELPMDGRPRKKKKAASNE